MLKIVFGVCLGLMIAVVFPGVAQVLAEKGGAARAWVKAKFTRD